MATYIRLTDYKSSNEKERGFFDGFNKLILFQKIIKEFIKKVFIILSFPRRVWDDRKWFAFSKMELGSLEILGRLNYE